MLTRSRASRSIDVQRLGQALARPGLDTRAWIVEAVVKAFKLDPEEGPFADVIILPLQQEETVRVGSFYSGPGFGFYAPLEKDDHVLVSFPNGDPDQGGVVVARLWSASDAPPQLAKDNDGDVCLHVKSGANLRIQVFGDGNLVLGAENGKVLLGDETGTQPVHRKGDHEKASVQMSTWMGQVETFINTLAPATVAPLSGTFATNPGIAEAADGSGKVESS